MNILNQPINTSSRQSTSPFSKDPTTKTIKNQVPASVRFDATPNAAKQSPSSLTCKASNILHEEQSETAQFEPYTLNFLQSIFQEEKFTRARGAQSLVLTVSVCSAVALDQTQIDLIAKKMRLITGFTNIRLENTLDPSLIAGFVIRYGMDESSVIDLSVKGQLAALANQVEASDNRAHIQS